MIGELDKEETGTRRLVQCDVAVVGGGIAGSVIACELARRGARVVLLESGGLTQDEDFHPLNRVVQAGQVYRGAEHGRFRCLGGTSSRWGGALIPFREDDLDSDTTPGRSGRWPVELNELLRYLSRVELLFRLPPGPYELPSTESVAADTMFVRRAAKWPAFPRRNVARLLGSELRSTMGPRVWLNATVTGIRLSESGRVASIEARSPSGSQLSVTPTITVMAAGAIESTRLLLKLDADYDRRVFETQGIIGRSFHDHLSAPVATIRIRERAALNALVGFQFQGEGMRNSRFELGGAERRRHNLPGAFVHIAFATSNRNGFDALRDVYRSLQRGRRPETTDLALLASEAGWLSRAVWTRFVGKRVLPPDDARFEVHVVTEQVPAPSNRITLSLRERDAFGVPLAEISWRVSEQDVENSLAIRDLFAEFWSRSSLSRLGDLEIGDALRLADVLAAGGGIYHPGGPLPMSSSPQTGVVDPQLRTYSVPNLRVVSTATFPSAGAANPTMMLLLFALRAADDISHELAA